MGGEAAAVLRDPGPVALGDALEAPGGEEQQRYGGGQAEEEQRRDQPEHHRGDHTAQQGAEEFRRPLDQQRFQAVDVAVGAGNDAPGLGPVEIADAQRLHMGEHADAQLVEHADRGAAGDVLGYSRQHEARRPGGGQAERQPGQQILVQGPGAVLFDQAVVEQFADEPGPQEHCEHQHQFEGDHREDVPAHRAEQRQQATEHAAVEGLPGEHFLDFDVAEGLAG
ncbi:hypothetical protein D9M69_479000 [compost metagenome]